MEKMTYNKKFRDSVITFIFFLLLSSAFIIFPIISKIQYNNLVANMESVEATIIDIHLDFNRRRPDEQEISITYEVDGVVYNRELGTDTKISFPAGTGTHYSVGDTLIIFYNPQNPNEIATPLSVSAGYFYLVIGLVSFVLFVAPLVMIIKNRQKYLITKQEFEKQKLKRKNPELEGKNGEKIRRQYFNLYIGAQLSFAPAVSLIIIISELKKGNFDIYGMLFEMANTVPAVLKIYAIFLFPFVLLSILNRFCFGKVLGVVNDFALYLKDRELDINDIVKIVYYPGSFSRHRISSCGATFTVDCKNGNTQTLDVASFPLYGLKKIKKYNPNVKLSIDKSFWFLALCPTVICVILALLIG